MPSTSTLKRYIARTREQLRRQKKKAVYARSLPEKIKAKDEVERLKLKLAGLQNRSNEVANAIRDKKADRPE